MSPNGVINYSSETMHMESGTFHPNSLIGNCTGKGLEGVEDPQFDPNDDIASCKIKYSAGSLAHTTNEGLGTLFPNSASEASTPISLNSEPVSCDCMFLVSGDMSRLEGKFVEARSWCKKLPQSRGQLCYLYFHWSVV